MDLHADVLIVTATKLESKAVVEVFQAATRQAPEPRQIGDRMYQNLGIISDTNVFMVQSEMGTGGLGASMQTVQKGIDALSPAAVIMVGIAFGIDPEKQAIGDILVSEQLLLYDLQRVGTVEGTLKLIPRGDRPHATPRLISQFRSADLYWDESKAKVHFGLILSGEKLVDNIDFREQLREFEPEAVGGEMEGAGVYVACQEAKVDWILVKSICDWADGHKAQDKDERQRLAAYNAASFVLHLLQQAPLKLEGDRPEPVTQTPVLHKNTTGALDEWLNATVRIRIGDYYSVESRLPIRVEVTDIRMALIPDKYSRSTGAEEKLAVELRLGLGGAIVYGGARTVYVSVNKYLVPRIEFDESAESIYAFHTTDQWFTFFRISVTHINSQDRCADVSIVELSVNAR